MLVRPLTEEGLERIWDWHQAEVPVKRIARRLRRNNASSRATTSPPWWRSAPSRPGARGAGVLPRLLRPCKRFWRSSGPVTSSSRIWMSALVRAVRAERLATRSALTASTG